MKAKHPVFIVVACHTKAEVPSNVIYFPVEAGAALHIDHFYEFQDNTGDNISIKNPNYCELTSVYWAWKNVDYDILGLVHYRRYFSKGGFGKKMNSVMNEEQIRKALKRYDIILPKKRHYYIESNYSHYVHSHPKEPLDKMREVIKESYPDYLNSFDEHMKKRSGHYFNMFIAKKEIINPFLDFMFDVLGKVESSIDISAYSDYDKRTYGFLSELLFDVYCNKNELKIKNQKYFFTGKQNWVKKIFNFLKRKFSK